jgi:hypothetical protein
VTELGVGELVKATSCCHAEVAPHVVTATEVELCNCTTARPKTLHVHVHVHNYFDRLMYNLLV